MRHTPILLSNQDSCYCKGWRWLVTSKLHTATYSGGFSVNACPDEIAKGAIPHKDYYPGDVIEDRYFAPHCVMVANGSLMLLDEDVKGKVSKHRSIDDPWSVNGY